MNKEANYSNNPLTGVGLKTLLTEIVGHYGFEILYAYLNINCFKNNPSIESSIKFLKKTDWAREKVEVFYLYEYKNLPKASSEQFSLPPRDRIIPDDQVPGKPAELSLEDAERLHENRAKKSASRRDGSRTNRRFDSHRKGSSNKQNDNQLRNDDTDSSDSSDTTNVDDSSPWANWKKPKQ